jgi:hypothetical protein
LRLRRLLRKAIGIAPVVGEADYFIALVVVAKNDGFAAEFALSRCDPFIHGVIRKNEIIFQTA